MCEELRDGVFVIGSYCGTGACFGMVGSARVVRRDSFAGNVIGAIAGRAAAEWAHLGRSALAELIAETSPSRKPVRAV